MRKNGVLLAAVLVAASGVSSPAQARTDLNVNINVGAPAVPVVPVAPVKQVVVIEEPPEFIYPSPLGFYVAVGVPYDLFLVSNTYYLYRDGGWYRASRYNGPWISVKNKHLPHGLRKHKIERIRVIREDEHRHFRGKRFKPEKEWKRDHRDRGRDDRGRGWDDHDRGRGRDDDRGRGRGHD